MIETTHHGLRRIVVIESKQIAFADIELGNSTQLVGENGRGKTTIINSLQFLYVPDERKWFFGKHSPRETKDFYFPPDRVAYSRILFEVMTPTGLAVVGVMREGALGYNLVHFIYRGAFIREDHIAPDRTVINWDQVEAIIAQKDFRRIDNLEDALMSIVGDTALGLVPLKKQGGSEAAHFATKFVPAFQRMLRLQSLTQSDMQQMLIDHGQISPAQREFNPRDQWNDQIERLMLTFEKTKKLSDAAPSVSLAQDQYERLNNQETWLWDAHKLVIDQKQAAADNYQALINKTQAEAVPTKAKLAEVEAELKGVQEELSSVEKDGYHRSQEVKRIEAQALDYQRAGYSLDLEVSAVLTMTADRDTLAGRLTVGQLRPLAELRVDYEKAVSDFDELTEKIDKFSKLLVSLLREKMSEQEIADAFSVIDPKTLSLIEGDKFTINDVPELVARLKVLGSRVKKGRYSDDVVTFTPPSDTQRELSKLASVDSLKQSLAVAEKTKSDFSRQIADAEAAENLKAEIKALDDSIQTKQEAITLFRRHAEEVESLPARRQVIKGIVENELRLKSQIAAIGLKKAALEEQLSDLKDREEAVGKKITHLSGLVGTLRPPTLPLDPSVSPPTVSCALEEFDSFVAEYARQRELIDRDRQRWSATS